MSNHKISSKEVAHLLERTAARTFNMHIDEIAPAFDEVEATCLDLVSSGEQKLEVKRRVAEWKMRLYCDRNASIRIVEALHNHIVELGYSNLEIEGRTEIYFAQYCDRQGHSDQVRQTLLQLRAKLESALMSKDLEVYRHFKEVSDHILSNNEDSKH